MCKETEAATSSRSHPSRAETGANPPTQEIDKNLLLQQTINAILQISLEPICFDEQMSRMLALILRLPWLARQRKGWIYLADEDAKVLVLESQVGMSAGVLSTCSRVPFGTCLCGRAIADNEIVFANRVDACHSILYPGIQPHGHYCIPLSSGGRRVGLLNLYVEAGHPRSADEERFLRAVADVLAGVIERERTQERLKEQLRLMAFGWDVGLALVQENDLPTMLRQCAAAMVQHLNGAFARIWTLNEADNVLELQASAGLYTHTDGAHRCVPVGRYKIGRIARERRSHLTNAVLNDPLVHDQEWARREGMVAFAGYPLLVEDRLAGVMALFARHPLSEATLDAMASVANGIAAGIERKRTQERLLEQLIERRKSERRLAAEHAVSRILVLSQSLHDAALKIIQAICENLGWDVGAVWVVDPKDNLLRCVEIWHRPGVEAAAFEEAKRRCRFSRGVGMAGRVWASGKFVWVPDMSTDTSLVHHQLAAECGLHGAAGFPICNREAQGVLSFFSRELRQPDDELIQMMTSIGSQITQFLERCQAEEELHRQAEDRRIARQIQQGLLPKGMPVIPGYQISGRSTPAQDVGGDCFDFLTLQVGGEECMGVLVADASGHGVGAALLMAQIRAYLQGLALACTEGIDIGTLLTLSNRRLAGDLVTDHFVTLLLVRLVPGTRSLVHTGAGHWPGYVLDGQGRTRAVLASTGCPLGIDPASSFPTGSPTTLERGDVVFLFTDGIVEAASPDGKQLGLERALGIVRAHRQDTPDAILDALFEAVEDFSGHHLNDDITAVIIKADGVG